MQDHAIFDFFRFRLIVGLIGASSSDASSTAGFTTASLISLFFAVDAGVITPKEFNTEGFRGGVGFTGTAATPLTFVAA